MIVAWQSFQPTTCYSLQLWFATTLVFQVPIAVAWFYLSNIFIVIPHLTSTEHSCTRSLATTFTATLLLQFSSFISYKPVTSFSIFASEAFISLLVMKYLHIGKRRRFIRSTCSAVQTGYQFPCFGLISVLMLWTHCILTVFIVNITISRLQGAWSDDLWYSYWRSGCLTDRPSESLTDWPTDWLTDRRTEETTGKLS